MGRLYNLLSKMPLLLSNQIVKEHMQTDGINPSARWPGTFSRAPFISDRLLGLPMDRGRQGRLKSLLEVGCLISLWPLAVATTDETMLLRRNRKI